MRPFTGEELETLKQFEKNFDTAVHQNYARNIPTDAQELIRKTYEDALGKPYSSNGTCSYCIYSMLKTVGTKYFADKEKYEKKAEKLVEVLDEVFGEVPDEEVQGEPEPKPVKKAPAKKSTKKATKKK